MFIERGGRFRLTPLYDIMSVYPILGHENNSMPPEKLKLAMGFSGKNRHYEWAEIRPWQLRETARHRGMEGIIESVLNRLATSIPKVAVELSVALPKGFPGSIAGSILEGLERQNRKLGDRDEAR